MDLSRCDECGAEVVLCDNDVALNYPAVPYDAVKAGWTIMSLGAKRLASVGNPSIGGTGHSLHEHQPQESAMA